MATSTKRQRKRKVYLCPACKSPFSKAHTAEKYDPKPSPPPPPQAPKLLLATPQPYNREEDYSYVVSFYCLSCKNLWEDRTRDYNLINDIYDGHINANTEEIKSPFEVELKFVSIQIDKTAMKKAANLESISKHGMPAFFAYCQDRGGLLYRFGGKSAHAIELL